MFATLEENFEKYLRNWKKFKGNLDWILKKKNDRIM